MSQTDCLKCKYSVVCAAPLKSHPQTLEKLSETLPGFSYSSAIWINWPFIKEGFGPRFQIWHRFWALNTFQLPSHVPLVLMLFTPLMAHKRDIFSNHIRPWCVFFFLQVHMQVICSSERGMKRASLQSEAQVAPRCNYRNPLSCENNRRLGKVRSFKEMVDATLQVIYFTRAFHNDKEGKEQKEIQPQDKHVRKSCIIQATKASWVQLLARSLLAHLHVITYKATKTVKYPENRVKPNTAWSWIQSSKVMQVFSCNRCKNWRPFKHNSSTRCEIIHILPLFIKPL